MSFNVLRLFPSHREYPKMGYSQSSELRHMTTTSQVKLLTYHSWARDLLVEKFRSKIQDYLTTDNVMERVKRKARLGDDIYEAMLSSVDRNQYLSMMTLWSVGQGIGVRVRHWVEEAIKDLIIYQKENFGREIENVYTFSDLRRSRLLADTDMVAMAGEGQTEHSHKRHWRVPVRTSIVRVAERLSEEVDRSYEHRGGGWRWESKNTQSRAWNKLPDSTDGPLKDCPVETTAFQEAWLREVALSPEREAVRWQKIVCNLLVLEKPPGKVRAFRFASPRLSSLRALHDEKKNLLLLYGWLRQEKPFRVYQNSVQVSWTHLLDRDVSPSQEFFFGNQVLGSAEFWEYLGVPYGVLLDSLSIAGQSLKGQIRGAVREAAPRSIRKLDPDKRILN
jgi:hypothetical protein